MSDSVPEGWSRVEFDNFTTLQRGKDLTKAEFREGTVPVAGSNGIIGYHDTAIAKAPGITVGRSGSAGKVTIYEEDFWPHNTSLYVRDFHGNDPYFAGFLLGSLNLARFKTGASVPTLDRNSFKTLPLLIPPFAEQKKIAHILSTVQRAIEAQERIIQTTTELKKALMHRLFTEGLHNEPQKQTEIGPIPESWELTAVGDVCRSIVPGRNKPKVFDGDIPWLTTPNIKGLDYINADVGGLRVTPDELKSSGGRLVPHKSVIMSCVGEFGVSAVTNIEIVINQQLHAFVCPANLNPVFLCNQLRYRKTYMERIAAITTIPYLNKSKCESVPIALPNREKQDEIAHCFETLDSKRNEHVRHKQVLQDLFQTLLHELMTAKTRVYELGLSV